MNTRILLPIAFSLVGLSTIAPASILFNNPGWAYSYEANLGQDAYGNGGISALDGTWNHDNGSDAWAGTLGGAGDGVGVGNGGVGGV